MTTKYRTTGIVFAKKDKNEADRIFNVYSCDFGLVELHAKAIRKINSKLKAGIDLFCLSEIEFIEGKNHKTLTDAFMMKKFNIFSAPKMQVAGQISQVLENFINGQQKDEQIFVLLKEAFSNLENLKVEKSEILFYYFVWNLLACQGYKPEMARCACCRGGLNPCEIYFSCKEGGIICKTCLDQDLQSQKINADTAKIIRIILNKNWEIASKLKIEKASIDLFKKISQSAVKNFCPA